MMGMTVLPEISEDVRQNFAELLEKSFETTLKPGVIVPGEVLKMEKDGLIVDIGGKSEGLVPLKEVPNCYSVDELRSNYQIGQVLELFLLTQHDGTDETRPHYTLSIRRVNQWKNWDRLQELQEARAIVEATVSSTTKGGVIVSIMGFKGFIPASQLRVAKTLHELIGEVLPAKILEVDKHKNKLILSHREAVFEQKAKMRAETIARLSEEDVVEGDIVKITDFGVFVDIDGIDGLLPLSEITWRRIQHPSEVLTLGQRVTVRVLTVDRNLQRISLSLKRLQLDPWQAVPEQFKIGDEVVGRISKLLASGVLGELSLGVEAYCAYEHNGPTYYMNESYRFRIVSIFVQERKITLEYLGPAPVSSDRTAEDSSNANSRNDRQAADDRILAGASA